MHTPREVAVHGRRHPPLPRLGVRGARVRRRLGGHPAQRPARPLGEAPARGARAARPGGHRLGRARASDARARRRAAGGERRRARRAARRSPASACRRPTATNGGTSARPARRSSSTASRRASTSAARPTTARSPTPSRPANSRDFELKPIFSSDIGHWDAGDISGVVAEAFELVEHGVLTDEQFARSSTRTRPSLFLDQNPRFFEGTPVAERVRRSASPADALCSRARLTAGRAQPVDQEGHRLVGQLVEAAGGLQVLPGVEPAPVEHAVDRRREDADRGGHGDRRAKGAVGPAHGERLLPEIERLVAAGDDVGQLVDPDEVRPVVVQDRELRVVVGAHREHPPQHLLDPIGAGPVHRQRRPLRGDQLVVERQDDELEQVRPSTGSASTGSRPADRSPRRCRACWCWRSPAGRRGPWRPRRSPRAGPTSGPVPAATGRRPRRGPRTPSVQIGLAVHPGVDDALARGDEAVDAAGEVVDPRGPGRCRRCRDRRPRGRRGSPARSARASPCRAPTPGARSAATPPARATTSRGRATSGPSSQVA